MFQLFRNVSKQNWNKLWKRWKYPAPFLLFRNTETMDYIGKLLKRTETGRKLTKSKWFSCFEKNWNKLWKRWKYQAPFLVFRNTQIMDYIGKKIQSLFNFVSKCFETTETFGLSQFSSRFSPFQFFPYIIHCFSFSKHQKWGLVFSPFSELVSVLFRNDWNIWT